MTQCREVAVDLDIASGVCSDSLGDVEIRRLLKGGLQCSLRRGSIVDLRSQVGRSTCHRCLVQLHMITFVVHHAQLEPRGG